MYWKSVLFSFAEKENSTQKDILETWYMEPQLQNDTYPISTLYCNCTNGLILHHGLMLFLKDYSNFYADVLGFFPQYSCNIEFITQVLKKNCWKCNGDNNLTLQKGYPPGCFAWTRSQLSNFQSSVWHLKKLFFGHGITYHKKFIGLFQSWKYPKEMPSPTNH